MRRHGQFDACEDAVQEALLAATLQWPKTGVPEVNLSRPRRVELTVRADLARRGTAFLRLFKAPEDADQKSDESSVAPRNEAAPENVA